MHPVSVVEQRRDALGRIDQQAVEPAVQSRRKRRILFSQVDEVVGTLQRTAVPLAPQPLGCSGLGVFLSREYEGGVAAFGSSAVSPSAKASFCTDQPT